jgi:hypothetical protein
MRLPVYSLLISAVLIVTATALLYILTPPDTWSSNSIAAAVVLVMAIGSVFLLPATASTTTNIGLLGPISIFGIFYVITSSFVFAFTITNQTTLSFAINIANLSLGLIGILVLGASSKIVTSVVNSSEYRSLQTVLSEELLLINADTKNAKIKCKLDEIVEQLRFVPRERFTESYPQHQEIMKRLQSLRHATEKEDLEMAEFALKNLQTAIALSSRLANLKNSKV